MNTSNYPRDDSHSKTIALVFSQRERREIEARIVSETFPVSEARVQLGALIGTLRFSLSKTTTTKVALAKLRMEVFVVSSVVD